MTSAFRLDDRNLFRLAYNLRGLRRPNISHLNPTVFVSGTLSRMEIRDWYRRNIIVFRRHTVRRGTKLNVQASVLCTLGKGVIDEYLFIDSANGE